MSTKKNIGHKGKDDYIVWISSEMVYRKIEHMGVSKNKDTPKSSIE